jgi:hypothetical protein
MLMPHFENNNDNYEIIQNNSILAKKIILDKKFFVNENKSKVKANYEELELLGKGGYGEVKKVHHKLTG